MLTVDEFLDARITLPAGTSPVSLEDMERAIAEGGVFPIVLTRPS